MNTFADRLRITREEKGLTQDALAKLVDRKKTQSIISNLESGANKSSTFLPEIAHILGVDAYWLKTGRGSKQGSAHLDSTQQILLDAFPLLDEGVREIWLSSARAALKKAVEEKRKAA